MLDSRDAAFFAANLKRRNRARKPLVDPRAGDHFNQQNAVIAPQQPTTKTQRCSREPPRGQSYGPRTPALDAVGCEDAISEVPQGAMAFVTGIGKGSMQNNLVSA